MANGAIVAVCLLPKHQLSFGSIESVQKEFTHSSPQAPRQRQLLSFESRIRISHNTAYIAKTRDESDYLMAAACATLHEPRRGLNRFDGTLLAEHELGDSRY
jgi:hypothetical protein